MGQGKSGQRDVTIYRIHVKACDFEAVIWQTTDQTEAERFARECIGKAFVNAPMGVYGTADSARVEAV